MDRVGVLEHFLPSLRRLEIDPKPGGLVPLDRKEGIRMKDFEPLTLGLCVVPRVQVLLGRFLKKRNILFKSLSFLFYLTTTFYVEQISNLT